MKGGGDRQARMGLCPSGGTRKKSPMGGKIFTPYGGWGQVSRLKKITAKVEKNNGEWQELQLKKNMWNVRLDLVPLRVALDVLSMFGQEWGSSFRSGLMAAHH